MPGLVALNLQPDSRILKQFGYIAVVGFGLLAFAALRERALFAFGLGIARLPVAVALGALGVFSGIASLVYPKANRPVYLGISVLTFPIGFVLSFLIMGILFYVIFGIVAILLRVFRRDDPMHRAYDPAAASYWIVPRRHRSGAGDKDRYFRQF